MPTTPEPVKTAVPGQFLWYQSEESHPSRIEIFVVDEEDGEQAYWRFLGESNSYPVSPDMVPKLKGMKRAVTEISV